MAPGVGFRFPGIALALPLWVACLVAAAPSHADPDSPPLVPSRGDYYYRTLRPGAIDYDISEKPTIIAAQVAMSVKRFEQAQQMLARSTEPDDLATALEVITDGYALLRTACHGLEMAMSKSKYPNPMVKWRLDTIWSIRWPLVRCKADLDGARQGEAARLGPALDALDKGIVDLKALLPRML